MIVDEEHFAYLSIQKGGLHHLVTDYDAWKRAYEDSLLDDLEDLRGCFPVKSVLDIGSGLGGINALINEENGGEVDVCLLDGANDPPIMNLHRNTFNNMRVAADFLRKNGVHSVSFEPPAAPQSRPFDLIISLGSWCFHYEPETYLEFVMGCFVPGTKLVLDVRRDKPRWQKTLAEAFGSPVSVIRTLRKADRTLFMREQAP